MGMVGPPASSEKLPSPSSECSSTYPFQPPGIPSTSSLLCPKYLLPSFFQFRQASLPPVSFSCLTAPDLKPQDPAQHLSTLWSIDLHLLLLYVPHIFLGWICIQLAQKPEAVCFLSNTTCHPSVPVPESFPMANPFRVDWKG